MDTISINGYIKSIKIDKLVYFYKNNDEFKNKIDNNKNINLLEYT